MNALKRPEVIVLLALVLAGLGWVALDLGKKWPAGRPAGGHEIEITKVESFPEGLHRRLRLEVTGINAGAVPLEFRAPTVRLLDANGATIPEFFQPGVFPPALPPGVKATTAVEFWLPEAQADGALELEIDGRRWPVRLSK
jgi:hypothetical protein